MNPALDQNSLVILLIAMLPIGFLIGSIGIGGVLLAPSLVYFAEMDVHDSIALSMASFVIPGLFALWTTIRSAHVGVHHRRQLLSSAIPGAFLGALVLHAVPAQVALATLAIFMLLTGMRVMFGNRIASPVSTAPTPRRDGAIGAVTGFLSAVTGTGGPMVMVPILLWSGTPVLHAVFLGQLAQLPVASLATAGNMIAGDINVGHGLVLGLLLVPGIALGRLSAAAMPLALMTRLVSTILIAVGAWLAIRAVQG